MPSRASAPPDKVRLRHREMETLGGFPYLPALRLRRTKSGFAIASCRGDWI